MKDYTCEDARRWLTTLTDRGKDLPSGLHFHLTTCDPCRGLATDYQAALSAYRTVTNDDISVPRFSAVREATKTNIRARSGWKWLDALAPRSWGWPMGCGVALVAVLVILVVSLLARGGGTPGPSDGARRNLVEVPRAGETTVEVEPLVAQSSGVAVGEGQSIASGVGETLDAAGNSTLKLEADSELLIQRWRTGTSVLRLERGAVRASVAKRQPGDRFEVRTREAVVSVRGTSFTVRRDGRGTEVTVHHGEVAVEPLTGGRAWVSLQGGQRWHSADAADQTTRADGGEDAMVSPPAPPTPAELAAKPEAFTPRRVKRAPASRKAKTPSVSADTAPKAGSVATPKANVEAALDRARQLLADREDGAARKLLESLVHNGRGGAVAQALLGDSKRIGKDYRGAIAAYQHALKSAAPRFKVRLLADLAGTQAQLGDKAGAAATWNRYLGAAPNGRARGRAHLAVAKAATEWNEAEVHLKAILRDHPKSREATRAMERLGRGLAKRGRYNEATEVFSAQARSTNGRRAQAAFVGLMRIAKSRGRTAELKSLAAAYQKRFPNGSRKVDVEALMTP